MIWLMLLTLIVVFIVGFRVLNSQKRRAAKALTRRLNIEPIFVESLITLMGRTAGDEFVAYLGRDNETHLSNAAMVLLIYHVFIVDESEENLTFWRGVLRKAYLPTEMSSEHVRLALVFYVSWNRIRRRCMLFVCVIISVLPSLMLFSPLTPATFILFIPDRVVVKHSSAGINKWF